MHAAGKPTEALSCAGNLLLNLAFLNALGSSYLRRNAARQMINLLESSPAVLARTLAFHEPDR
jgi:hypothetical protein